MSPDLVFWFELALKMTLTATVVVVTSIAVERSGPFIGAMIAALPTAAGAAYAILAIEHPPAFIAASAVGSVAIGAAVSVFAAVYAVTIPLSWRYRSSAAPKKFLRRAYDIPLRALAAAAVVVAVTTASYSIGSFASGMFALFPIILCCSIVILHPRVGGWATASVMAHAQVAFIGLTLGFLGVHYLAEPLGSWAALGIGLCIAIAWSGMLVLARSRALKAA